MLNDMSRYLNRFSIVKSAAKIRTYNYRITKLTQDLCHYPDSQLLPIFKEIGRLSSTKQLVENIHNIDQNFDSVCDIISRDNSDYNLEIFKDNSRKLMEEINDVLDHPNAVYLLNDKLALIESYGRLIFLGETKYIRLFIDTVNEIIGIVNRLKRN